MATATSAEATSAENTVLTCPNGHAYPLPTRECYVVQHGLGYLIQSAENPDQMCPTCGAYRQHPDGTTSFYNVVGLPRPTGWLVDELLADVLAAHPTPGQRAALVNSGELRRHLEAWRGTYAQRGVVLEYDEVIETVIAAVTRAYRDGS
jgi:hypothetical protein